LTVTESIITSTATERFRLVRSLNPPRERRRERCLLVEGVRLVEDALRGGLSPRLALIDLDHLGRSPRGLALVAALRANPRAEVLAVSDRVLASVTETVTPQGVVAVFAQPAPAGGPDLGPFALVLDGVRDPGNLGTILRSAEASGAVGAILLLGCADVWSPKVVRSGMGAHFRLTLLPDLDWLVARRLLGVRPIWLADMSGGVAYDDVDWTRDSALVMGGEANGASAEARESATGLVSIPMAGVAESLNVAMATSIIVFEAARQRRTRQH
jgi:TrmH family RNA methyltransferase